jgi:hypothetical protein
MYIYCSQRHGEVIEKAKQRKLEQLSTEMWKKNCEPQRLGDAMDDEDVQVKEVTGCFRRT